MKLRNKAILLLIAFYLGYQCQLGILMKKRKLHSIKKDIYEHWTDTAVQCYEQKGICSTCYLKDICLKQPRNNDYKMPPMKYTVLKLLENCGKPEPYAVYQEAYNRDFSKRKFDVYWEEYSDERE